MIVWSYGGGVQSVAIGVLIGEGALPVPDLAFIVDTSREIGTTWTYLYQYMEPYLAKKVGLKIEIIPHSLASVDVYRKTGLPNMPVHTSEGRIGAYCSGDWKRDVCERWLRLQGVKNCEMWIGYSIEELRRVPENDHRGWCKLAFPLIDKFINRAMCVGIIQAAGLPVPHKSRCWMCPYQSPEEWLEVKRRPDEWAAAVALEKEIQTNDPEGDGRLYLYSGRVPLELATFEADAGLAPPARPCETGHCWT